MPTRCLLLCTTLALVLASCASGSRLATTDNTTEPRSAAAVYPYFPSSVGDFAESNRERYDNPAAGVRVGYVTPKGLASDAFLYPIPSAASDSSVSGRRTAARTEAMKAGRTLAARGTYADLELAPPADLEVTGAASLLPGTYIAASMRQQGRPVLSDIYVFVVGDQFLKIRATYPGEARSSAARAEVRMFAASLAAVLEGRMAAR